jgi:hypothetical protein
MANLNTLLEKFITDEITLDQKDITAAVKSREWFLTRLENKINNYANQPFLYKQKPFVYFGSYFKGTKVSNVDEFDVLVVIDSSSGVFSRSGSQIGIGLGDQNPNPKYNKAYYKSDSSGVSPSKMLNWLKTMASEVIEPYGGSIPERDGQAITVEIQSQNLKIDLVPAGIFSYPSRQGEFYNIPDGSSGGGWTITNPEVDKRLINELAKDRLNFKNVIRLLKFIRDKFNLKISSFAIECVVVDFAQRDDWRGNFPVDFLLSLNHLAQRLNAKSILDMFDTDTNLLDNIDDSISTWYGQRMEGLFNEILALEKRQDETAAYEKLKKLLNNA